MGEVYGIMRIFLKYSPPEPTPKQARKKIQAEKRIQKNQVQFKFWTALFVYTEKLKEGDGTSEAICNGKTSQSGQRGEYAGLFAAPPA
jgi:hypothetical protein